MLVSTCFVRVARFSRVPFICFESVPFLFSHLLVAKVRLFFLYSLFEMRTVFVSFVTFVFKLVLNCMSVFIYRKSSFLISPGL